VDLHQRLSEFSYGYGVTREVEKLLISVGLNPTPFMPNLLHESKLGFDVAFERPGTALLLQFKLGEAVQRFRRTNTSKPAPRLGKPFWRFSVDTAEPDGQYDLLLKAEQAGAEVYYVAPRFTSWDRYVRAFQGERVLRRSLLIGPSQIDAKLAMQREPDGWHRVVYDRSSVYVCSERGQVEEVRAKNFAEIIRTHIMQHSQRTDDALKRVYKSLERRREIRVEQPGEADEKKAIVLTTAAPPELASTADRLASDRNRRLDGFRSIATNEGDAIFAAVGVEAWASGSQLVAVTLNK
jgi:hypothetical protein